MVDLDDPRAQSGQVRVRVKAAGVLPFDCRAREGGFPKGLTGDFPIVPGNEFAGVIDQVGDDVTGFTVGDEVLGFSTLKSYAEYTAVSADQIVKKPASMSWETAGAFSGTAQGAHMALEQMRIVPGETVLINGAAGGLGTMATQLAAHRGAAVVIGTASEQNHDHLRSLGAVAVTYGDGLADRVRAIAPEGVDGSLGVDLAALRASVEVTKDVGRVVAMVYTDEVGALGIPEWSSLRNSVRLAEMVELFDKGALRVHLRAVYPLESAAEAHRDVGSGHGRGKVVITID